MKLLRHCLTGTLISLAVPALSQTAGPSGKKVQDPNKVVCHDEEVTGSHLATRRECHTVAEWAEMQRQQRQDLEHSQANGGH